MPHASLKVQSPAPVTMPRGAIWAADAALCVLKTAAAAWRTLTRPAAGEAAPRSAAAMHRLARQVEGEQPSLAWEVRAIARHLRTFETTPTPDHGAAGGAR